MTAPCQRVYFVVTSPKKLGYAYLTTIAGANRLDEVIFLVAKYDVFRNGAVSSLKAVPAPEPTNPRALKDKWEHR